MRKIYLIFVLFISLGIFAQTTTLSIPSAKLKEEREITVTLPSSYEKSTTKKYPLLILLDGDYLIDPFNGTVKYGEYWDDLPEIIIVGINQNKNNERYADCEFDETTGLPTNKGESFFEFIGYELIPFIQSKYRISPFKIIAGHDTTAGFLNFYLYKESPLFNAYICMSPELPANMEKNIPERLKAFNQPIFYYLSTASGDLKKMHERILALDKTAKTISNPTLNYKFDDFKGASHYSLVPYSIPNALYQIYEIYQPISINEFNEKIVTLPSGFVDYLTKKYDQMSKTLYLDVPIRLNDFKAIEAAILKNKAYLELEKLSEVAKKSYPKSMLSDYEMGLMFEKEGDTKKAISFYQKAYQKEEIGDLTKEMMLDKMDYLKGVAKAEKAEKEAMDAEEKEIIEEVPAETPTEEKKPE
ncbi:MAG TPA: alpha/beta hydrolase-fold protein [Flavobacterium sp.]|jgi:hypothetical protein|nr:alpha/beta hydrolase-fold protein [Flavobacterium sp.]